jgi:hypothetical protein
MSPFQRTGFVDEVHGQTSEYLMGEASFEIQEKQRGPMAKKRQPEIDKG